MPVDKISGDRASSSIYLYEEHIYVVCRRVREVLHVKCKFDECEATGIYCEGDDFIRVIGAHGHAVDRDEVDRLQFRNALREDAMLTTMDFNEIYNQLSPRYFAFIN